MKTRTIEYTDDAEVFTARMETDGIRLNSALSAGELSLAQRDLANLITFLTELQSALEASSV